MDNTIIMMLCSHFNSQALFKPIPIIIHFQGSVINTNKGIHEASRVTPDANAYTLKNFLNVTFRPQNMVKVIYPKPAAINVMPTALTKKMLLLNHGASNSRVVRLARAKKAEDTTKNPADCCSPTLCCDSVKKAPGVPSTFASERK